MKIIIENKSDEREIKKVLKRTDSYCGMRQTNISLDVISKFPISTRIVLDKTAGEGCIVSENDSSVVIYIT